MANASYPAFKQAIGQAGIGNAALDRTSSPVLKLALVTKTAGYTYNTAHDFHNDLTNIVGTPQAIGSPAFTGSVLDGNDVTFTALSGADVEALVIYLEFGAGGTSTWPLVLYLDTGITGVPFTPSGGDVQIQWDNGANKIYNMGGG